MTFLWPTKADNDIPAAYRGRQLNSCGLHRQTVTFLWPTKADSDILRPIQADSDIPVAYTGRK